MISKFLNQIGGAGAALLSALLFGLSVPLAKSMLGNTSPWLIAGVLYFGAGFGLCLILFIQRIFGKLEIPKFEKSDLLWLGIVTIFGGILAPILMMYGLKFTSAANASLLLNLESVATLLIAWIVYKEHLDTKLLIGAIAILLGALCLSWSGGNFMFDKGAIFIALACLFWGIDNNLTRKLSYSNPIFIAAIKCTIAGCVNLLFATQAQFNMPKIDVFLITAVIGFLGYGLSIALFVLSLRHLGAARSGAYFSTAPFIGAIYALIFMGEKLSIALIIAGVLMAIGVIIHLIEDHAHEHMHDEIEHSHAHIHDEHHQHDHSGDISPNEPHSHRHRHKSLVHSHKHFPDLHHRHSH
ncbi:DMT family transporter [Pseudaquidulcibacter saccharophilus]|uniref:DMT family transporter n=1 Tax=Pseudaquidulcibacter saccharophilus TaxID=2831900 RepID=UPI001EFF4F1F|nr:DMT family transporter [Pseudaquidulcibacter saccharophilus]